jgi:hypothetical protein
MIVRRLILSLVALMGATLVFSGTALATGGNYVFDGGTPYQQLQVRSALEASSFNWSLVTQQITIKIAPVAVDNSIPGTIYLDPDLLNSGQYSWGVVQNEYANEVDFFLLPEQAHATFNGALGGTAWCYSDQPGLRVAQYGCERFASTLAWAYWQSPDNCINPTDTGGISAGIAPDAFRALLTSTLGVETQTHPAAARTVSYYSTKQAAKPQTSIGTREIQTVNKTVKTVKTAMTAKTAKAFFSAPLKVSVERVASALTIAPSDESVW